MKILTNGKIVTEGKILEDYDIVIEDNKIVSVAKSSDVSG